MNPVESYILKLSKEERNIIHFFHSIFINKYSLNPAIKWNIPTYTGNSIVCYLNPDKRIGIHLCFMQGYKLTDTNKILERKNRKLVTSFHVKSLDEIPYQALIQNIEDAIYLDQSKALK